jgi:hypothetical protein
MRENKQPHCTNTLYGSATARGGLKYQGCRCKATSIACAFGYNLPPGEALGGEWVAQA